MKTILNYFVNKLFFKDIQLAGQPAANKSLSLIKTLCVTLILLVLIGGSLFTIKHAVDYYDAYKNDFLLKPEGIEEVHVESPNAVFFTKEEGDPYKIQGVLAYFEGYSDGTLSLLISNINEIPVEILSIQDKSGKNVFSYKGNMLFEPSVPIAYQIVEFENVDEGFLKNKAEMIVNYAYDNGVVKQVLVFPFRRIDDGLYNGTAIRTKNNIADFDFILEDDQFITFKGKEIIVEKSLFIPKGKDLLIYGGQKIDLLNGAYILARTPVQFLGDEENPILVHSSDGSGRGLFVSEANGKSNISHTTFNGLNAPQSGVWFLTGAVTFYESDVDINHSQFSNNVCEDGLNIIGSEFTISDSIFIDTFSDALDVDFCTGEIIDCVFEKTGNDAVDASTTRLEITDTEMYLIGDKGVSAGENSAVMIQNVEIDHAEIGIASKDLSIITGDEIYVSNAKIGITLYEKKPEFGPAEMDINSLILKGNIDLDYLIQKGSTLKIDGKIITPRSATKERLLFEKMIAGEPIQ